MTFRRFLVVPGVVAALALSACDFSGTTPSSKAPATPKMDAAPEISGEIGADIGLEAVRDAVTRALPNVPRDAVQNAEVKGLYLLQHSGQYGYVTADGQYLLDGDLVDLGSRRNLTESARKHTRVEKLAALGHDKLVVFAPKKPDPRRVVTVFTDVDCGYCRKLHREMNDYLAKGITIQYAFYPRSGPNTDSFRKAEAVWCADDRQKAMTQAKQGAPLTEADSSCANPVAQEYALGAELGLRGTPMLILPDGEVINGYMPAAALAQHLDESRG